MTDRAQAFVLPPHGGQLRDIAQHFGLPVEDLLDFSASVYPGGPPPGVIDTLREAILCPALLRDYPDLELVALRTCLARYAGVSAVNILVANGMAPLLDASLRALRPRRCLLPVPAFGEYRQVLKNCGVEIRAFPLSPDSAFHLDGEQLIGECRRRHCDALLLANPQNPSGVTLSRNELRQITGYAAECGIQILLDEAFIDFVPEECISNDVLESSKLIVYRSLTKFFGMAGMRIAYLAAHEDLCRILAHWVAPWPVSTLAALAACAAVEDTEYACRTILGNREERDWLRGELIRRDMAVFPGSANFLLFRPAEKLKCGAIWERLIAQDRIVVRNCASFEGLDASYLRTAVRSRADNNRLLQALSSLRL